MIVIGAGPAGEVAAGRAADGGLSVAIVEQHLIGGECSFYACMPSKALLRPGAGARRGAAACPAPREAVTGELDVAAALARRDEVIHDLDDSAQLPWLEQRDIALYPRPRRRSTASGACASATSAALARRAVIVATGSAAALPPVAGLADAQPVDEPRGDGRAAPCPARLLVLGGGVVGCELAQAFRSLGSTRHADRARATRLLGREEPFAAEQVEAGAAGGGVDVRARARPPSRVTRARRRGHAPSSSDGEQRARRRDPRRRRAHAANTAGLGLESVGVADDGPLETDDRTCASSAPRTGSTRSATSTAARCSPTGQVPGAHRRRPHPRAARATPIVHDGPLSPRVVFTEPQVAAVGHTLEQAPEPRHQRARGRRPDGGQRRRRFVGRNVPGTARIVVDTERGSSSARRSPAPRSPSSSTRRRSRSSARCRSRRLARRAGFPTRSEVWLKLLEAYGL